MLERTFPKPRLNIAALRPARLYTHEIEARRRGYPVPGEWIFQKVIGRSNLQVSFPKQSKRRSKWLMSAALFTLGEDSLRFAIFRSGRLVDACAGGSTKSRTNSVDTLIAPTL